ncbi:MAG: hypothetical protein WC319_00885 [Candidatus Paceibacterota bacterium]
MSNGQRNGIILQSIVEHRIPTPTNGQRRKIRAMTPEQAYTNFPTRKEYG